MLIFLYFNNEIFLLNAYCAYIKNITYVIGLIFYVRPQKLFSEIQNDKKKCINMYVCVILNIYVHISLFCIYIYPDMKMYLS